MNDKLQEAIAHTQSAARWVKRAADFAGAKEYTPYPTPPEVAQVMEAILDLCRAQASIEELLHESYLVHRGDVHGPGRGDTAGVAHDPW